MATSTNGTTYGRSWVRRATVLDAVEAQGNGTWTSIEGCSNFSIHVTGITNATVVVTGSNAPTEPAAATHGIVLATVTSDAIVRIDMPVRWVKVRVSAWTSGTISAYLEGV